MGMWLGASCRLFEQLSYSKNQKSETTGENASVSNNN